MSGQPWNADRPLDDALALATIRDQFPDLPARRISFLDSGWDNDAYLLDNGDDGGDVWLFRFPRRREVADTLAAEAAVTAAARIALAPMGVAVALTAYEHPLDPSFHERLAFLSRALPLVWLHEAHEMGGNDAMLRAWVDRAFACFPDEAGDGR